MIYGLNVEELIVGGVFGAFLWVFIGAWAILTVPLCAFLWAWTGAGNGAIWRKLGCPLVACIAIWMVDKNWSVWIGFLPMCLVLSMGYGIPSMQPPDEGSPLGRFWFKKFKGNMQRAQWATRATIYTLLALCFIPALF